MEKFTLGIVEVFEEEYLKKLNQVDIDRLLHVVETHAFFDILGRIDCMH